jgi:S-adenosylmethionine-dependent methyltransferase
MEAEPFYDEFAPQEWERLERHRTEFAITLKALLEFLPDTTCSVLDIGGGPGRYAIELARLGYEVTLMDISKKSLHLAKEMAEEEGVFIKAYIHGNALSTSEYISENFKAVLLMGPLYHLLLSMERVQAVQEGMRILEPGGRLFASFITRFAPFRDSAKNIPQWILENHDYAMRMLETGLHEKPTKFARAYFTHPDEIIPMMESCGLKTLRMVGCEGIVAGHEEMVNELQGEAWDAWVELNYRLGMEPTLYGASDHLLYVGEKPGKPRSGKT